MHSFFFAYYYSVDIQFTHIKLIKTSSKKIVHLFLYLSIELLNICRYIKKKLYYKFLNRLILSFNTIFPLNSSGQSLTIAPTQ